MTLAKKYMAASVPRFLRQARLAYLPLHCIIGSHVTKGDNGANMIFDVIMLPEDQFMRAKSYLAVPSMAGIDLQYGKFAPPYVVRDIKEVVASSEEQDAGSFAKDYFLKIFSLIEEPK